MPLYDYRATEPDKAPDCCREPFEVLGAFADDALTACPTCGGPVVRQIGAPAFLTKGIPRSTMSDANLKKHGFKKLVKEGDGKYRNVLG